MASITLFLEFLNYALPVVITLGIFVTIMILLVGSPYCHYVNLVSDANTDKGKENLAHYLAYKTGGKKIDASGSWRSFIPAATDLHTKHIAKKK